MFFRVAVHEESAAAEGFSSGDWIEPENKRTVIFAVDRRARDGPVALGNRANVVDILKSGIVLAFSSTGISGGDVGAILFEVASFLGVSPGLALEVVR